MEQASRRCALDCELQKNSVGAGNCQMHKNAIMVITHYQRLLDYIVPDYVHVLFDGKIVKSGTKDLALELEEKGYDWIKEELKK